MLFGKKYKTFDELCSDIYPYSSSRRRKKAIKFIDKLLKSDLLPEGFDETDIKIYKAYAVILNGASRDKAQETLEGIIPYLTKPLLEYLKGNREKGCLEPLWDPKITGALAFLLWPIVWKKPKILGDSAFVLILTKEYEYDRFMAYANDVLELSDGEILEVTKAKIKDIEKERNTVKEGTYEYEYGSYKGQILRDLPNGKGELVFEVDDSRDRYVGEFLDGQRTGYGILYFKDGDKYEGNFLDNKYHGFGKYTFNDGRMYEAEHQNDMCHGAGTFYYKNKDKFVGQYRNGQAYGIGSLYIYDKKKKRYVAKYVGENEDQEFNGVCEYYSIDENGKSFFESYAYYEDGKLLYKDITFKDLESIGLLFKEEVEEFIEYLRFKKRIEAAPKSECDTYLGRFQGDVIYQDDLNQYVPHGYGRLFMGDSVIEGKFNKGEPLKVIIHFTDGSLYYGEMKGGVTNGLGVTIYDDGTFARGVYTDGKPNKGRNFRESYYHNEHLVILSKDKYGKGWTRIYYPNGGWFDGEEKDYLPHGKGTYHMVNGSFYPYLVGEFVNGSKEGKFLVYSNAEDNKVLHFKNNDLC